MGADYPPYWRADRLMVLNKRINNPDAIDDFTCVQVFAIQDVATCNYRRLNDQSIVKRQAACLVQIQRAVNDGWRYLHQFKLLVRTQLLANMARFEAHIAQPHVGELLQDLR